MLEKGDILQDISLVSCSETEEETLFIVNEDLLSARDRNRHEDFTYPVTQYLSDKPSTIIKRNDLKD